MKVVWTDAAVCQLEAIRDFLAQTSLEYSISIVERLYNRSVKIGSFPRSGRMVPEYEIENVRQVIESNYRVIYLIVDARVEILAIIHTSRQPLSPAE